MQSLEVATYGASACSLVTVSPCQLWVAGDIRCQIPCVSNQPKGVGAAPPRRGGRFRLLRCCADDASRLCGVEGVAKLALLEIEAGKKLKYLRVLFFNLEI